MAKEVLTVYLLYVVIYQTLAINVDIPLPTYEIARGDNVTIPCSFKPKNAVNPTIIITWMAHADVESDPELTIVTLVYSKGSEELDYSELYSGRATLDYDITLGTANLKLNTVSSKDSRIYECKVHIPKDSEGKAIDSTKLVVLVPPSKPICAIQGKAEFYQNISLTCHSEEGTPTPTYKWTTFDLNNKSRPNPYRSTDVGGVLSLYNVSTETNGFFICMSTNKIRSNFCNLTLSVTSPSMNTASVAGIVGILVAVLLIALVVACCCCYRRKKAKLEEHPMGPQELEYTDREPHEIGEHEGEGTESNPAMPEDKGSRHDQYENRSEQDYNRSRDHYADDYDDRRGRLDNRRNDRYDDNRDYSDDRHSDRRDHYDDHRNDRRDRYDENRDYDDRHSDRRDHYDDHRNDRRDRSDY